MAIIDTPTNISGAHSRRRRTPLDMLTPRLQWLARRTRPLGYLWALVGVGATSLVIAAIESQAHIANISLVYLLVVIWLAASWGRGPAILAAFLSFLAYDLFFIPPLFHLTVDDPTQWLSLLTLLTTALVVGHLTGTVRAQAHDAQESRQRTEILYTLAQLIASTADETRLLDELAGWGARVFAPAGVRACALILPDAQGRPITRALACSDGADVGAALPLALTDDAVVQAATQAQVSGAPTSLITSIASAGASSALSAGAAPTLSAGATDGSAEVVAFAPLRSSSQVVGLLGLVGDPAIRRLLTRPTEAPTVQPSADDDPLIGLFAAFCDQLALALERVALRQQAIHAEALRESDQLKTALLGSVTHDLRTPLAGIKAAATTLLEPLPQRSDATQYELLATINASADRLNRLVSNLLDLSRLEAGVAQPHREWYVMDDVVAAALGELERAGYADEHQIVSALPPDLPLTLMDHEQIERVLLNLLENAIKYSPAQSVIRVEAWATDTELVTRVSDQGMGIAHSELAAIFDRFYRAQRPLRAAQPTAQAPWTPTRMPGGVGLGLAICANIIRAHGGRIWAESQPGAGASFTFTLPLSTERPQGELPELDAPVADMPAADTPITIADVTHTPAATSTQEATV